MSESKGWMECLGKLKRMKNIEIVIAVVIVGMILLLTLPGLFPSGQTGSANPQQTQSTQQDDGVEDQLVAILSQIQGAGDVEVMITYESGTEIVPAVNTQTQTNTSKETTTDGQQRITETENQESQLVTISRQGSLEPLVIKEVYPKVKGVIIVAQGARDIHVKLDLIQAVKTIFHIDSNQIDVFSMKD